jgi:hypothetical protein
MTTMGTAECLTGFEEALAQARADGHANVTHKVTTTTTTIITTTAGGQRPAPRRGRRTLADTLLYRVIQLQGVIDGLNYDLAGGLDGSVTADLADG